MYGIMKCVHTMPERGCPLPGVHLDSPTACSPLFAALFLLNEPNVSDKYYKVIERG